MSERVDRVERKDNAGSLIGRFNAAADGTPAEVYTSSIGLTADQDKQINAAAESTTSGDTGFIGRADQTGFHDEQEKARKKKQNEKYYADQKMLRQYLQDLQNILDQLDRDIEALIKRIQEREDRLNKNINEFDENETRLNAIDQFMTIDKPARKPDGTFEHDLINQIIIVQGYNPAELTLDQVRKILDQAANDIGERQDDLSDEIVKDTADQDKDLDELERKKSQREKIKHFKEKIEILSDREDLSFEEKINEVAGLKEEEGLTDTDLIEIRKELKEENKQDAAGLMSGTVTENKSESREESQDILKNEWGGIPSAP